VVALVETALLASPLALTIACAMVIERRRERRRRDALNRALHELRRPLQLLALLRSTPARTRHGEALASAWEHLDAALAALTDLESEINGARSPVARTRLRADELVGGAVERWRWPATCLGRELELRWSAGRACLLGDAAALSRALDNLLANSLEHGSTRVRIEGRVDGGRLRIIVDDDLGANGRGVAPLAAPLARRPSRDGDPRRGYGLAIVADIASAHGGRLALSRRGAGTRAVLELPLAADSSPAGRRSQPSIAA
jgi:signal transduction histidine kinase